MSKKSTTKSPKVERPQGWLPVGRRDDRRKYLLANIDKIPWEDLNDFWGADKVHRARSLAELRAHTVITTTKELYTQVAFDCDCSLCSACRGLANLIYEAHVTAGFVSTKGMKKSSLII